MKIYKLREVCSILDISEGTFYLWVKKEYIPKPLKNRRGHNVYTEDLLTKAQKYIEEMEYTLADISHEEEPKETPKSSSPFKKGTGKIKTPFKSNKPTREDFYGE